MITNVIYNHINKQGENEMTNTHGMTIKGLRKASGATVKCAGSSYSQIVYDMEDGTVSEYYHWTENEWTDFGADSKKVTVCNTRKHMTMQEIADKVYETVNELKHMKEEARV